MVEERPDSHSVSSDIHNVCIVAPVCEHEHIHAHTLNITKILLDKERD